jgi:lipid A ethanolaminephosphotransferase
MMFLSANKPFRITANILLLLCCAYLVLVLNFPFLSKAVNTVSATGDANTLFLLSVPIVLFCIFIFVQSLFSIRFLLKPVLIFTILLSSILFYATWQYGIVFDDGMLQNTLESDSAEAFSYLNGYAIVFFILFGVTPAWVIYKLEIVHQTLSEEVLSRLKLIGLSLVTSTVLMGCFYADYASVGRNHRDLITYVTPYKLYDATFKYIKRSVNTENRSFITLDAKPYIETLNTAKEVWPQITVLVIGETARAQNFSSNGYSISTNRYTEDQGVISFTTVSSCGTATAVSVPCMFSRLGIQDYNKEAANSQQNVLDIAKLAGVDVLWIENNNGGCKKVCDRVDTIYIDVDAQNRLCDGEYCFDEALLAHLNMKIAQQKSTNTLVVLHMIGSHGPTYFRRYPKEHRLFTPDCQRSDIQNCSDTELVNTYDNTIAYTDFVLNNIIGGLSQIASDNGLSASMLYVSDHGESLGEKGIYLHGLPYIFAPKEQTHIPMLYWQSDELSATQSECLVNIASKPASHDNLFDTLLGLLQVNSVLYNPNLDLLSPCKLVAKL